MPRIATAAIRSARTWRGRAANRGLRARTRYAPDSVAAGGAPPLFEPQQDRSVRTREAAQQAEREPVGGHVARMERKAQIGMQPSQLAAQRGGALGDCGLEPLEVPAQPAALQQRVVANG